MTTVYLTNWDKQRSPTLIRKPSVPVPFQGISQFCNLTDIPELNSALEMITGSTNSGGAGTGSTVINTSGVTSDSFVPSRPGTGGMAAFAAYAMRSAAIQAAAAATNVINTAATTTAISCSVNSAGAFSPSISNTATTSSSPLSPLAQSAGLGGNVGMGAPSNPPPSPVSPQAPPPLPFTITPQIDRPVHHWREGNLPANSKCSSCKKTCWSAECLTGMRCEWCGVTDDIRLSRIRKPRLEDK
ncbi:hypothetical protein ACTXT7_000563 [Hymenolepis weldensis]